MGGVCVWVEYLYFLFVDMVDRRSFIKIFMFYYTVRIHLALSLFRKLDGGFTASESGLGEATILEEGYGKNIIRSMWYNPPATRCRRSQPRTIVRSRDPSLDFLIALLCCLGPGPRSKYTCLSESMLSPEQVTPTASLLAHVYFCSSRAT